jgi:hypothetical protein
VHGGPDGQGARIVATDGERGDLDLRAGAWVAGSGYRRRSADGTGRDLALLRGVAALRDGEALPRGAAIVQLRPGGFQARHGAVVEALRLWHGAPVLSLCLEADAPTGLGVAVALGPDGGDVAVLASAPLVIEDWPRDARPAALRDEPDLRRLRVRAPTTRLLVHLVFGENAAERAAVAARLGLPREGVDAAAAGRAWRDGLARRHPGPLRIVTGDAAVDAAFAWSLHANAAFRSREFGPGLWAGLPWFRDFWGRDSFIALPGTDLVAGAFDHATAVLDAFAERQAPAGSPSAGRVPNRVAAGTDTLYNTVDGTPWMIRAAWETAQASGDASRLPALRRLVRAYVEGSAAALDADGLLRHDEADTWMDARIRGGRGWSPRGDRAIEVQALWHAALVVGADLARRDGDADEAARYAAMATRVVDAVQARFVVDGRLADRLLPDGRVDTNVRPNAWLAVSVPVDPDRAPLLPAPQAAAVSRDTAATLLRPQGPFSLDPADPRFHPRHVDDAHHHKDAAYHNGTVWPWTAGPAITALVRHGAEDAAWTVTRDLARQLLEDDAPGFLAELTDASAADGTPPRPSGTYAQSWSSAEFTRTLVQDYAGFRPRLLDGALWLEPRWPTAVRDVRADLPFGDGGLLRVRRTRDEPGGDEVWQLERRDARGVAPPRLWLVLRRADGTRWAHAWTPPTPDARLRWDGETARWSDGTAATPDASVALPALPPLGAIALAPEPMPPPGGWPVRQGRDVLERFIESGGLDRHPQPTRAPLLAPTDATKDPRP